jgi:hypothetical protein
MVLRGEALIQAVTLGFSVAGERGDWRINVTGPGHIENDSETNAESPYILLDAMLKTTFSEVARKFPQRVPPPYRDNRVRR